MNACITINFRLTHRLRLDFRIVNPFAGVPGNAPR